MRTSESYKPDFPFSIFARPITYTRLPLKATVSSFGTPVRADGTPFRAAGPSQREDGALESFRGMYSVGLLGAKTEIPVNKDEAGFDFWWDNQKDWVGMIFRDPSVLILQVYGDTSKIDPVCATGFREHAKDPHWDAKLNLA